MASGSKSDGVFNTNKMGGSPGESAGLKRSSYVSGEMLSAFPQDNVHGVNLPDTRGCTMGGGPMNLSHSLSGASAVQAVAPRNGKATKKEI